MKWGNEKGTSGLNPENFTILIMIQLYHCLLFIHNTVTNYFISVLIKTQFSKTQWNVQNSISSITQPEKIGDFDSKIS